MTAACPNCGSYNFQLIMPYRNQSKFLAGCDIAQCKDCDLNYIAPAPSEATWVSYNENYFKSAHDGLSAAPQAIEFHEALAKIRLEHVVKNLDLSIAAPTVLEIGPGVGYFAEQWRKRFHGGDYFVLESDISLHPTLREQGIRVLEEGIAQLENDSVDVCVMSHVLEHVIYPSDLLRDVNRLLRDDGLLFVEVPCLDFLYKNVHEPHMLFFSREALANCAKKAGFSNLRLTYHGDRISQIRLFDLLRRILIKLSRITNLPLTIGFSPNDDIVKLYGLTTNQALAVAQTRPFVTQDVPSRWLRMVARK